MRRRILLVLGLVVAFAVWTTALASGAGRGPGWRAAGDGLTDGKLRYLALPASRTTEVQVIDRDAHVLRHMWIKGIWGIPLVAYDGTAEGLFPNGQTLLLAQSPYNGQ